MWSFFKRGGNLPSRRWMCKQHEGQKKVATGEPKGGEDTKEEKKSAIQPKRFGPGQVKKREPSRGGKKAGRPKKEKKGVRKCTCPGGGGMRTSRSEGIDLSFRRVRAGSGASGGGRGEMKRGRAKFLVNTRLAQKKSWQGQRKKSPGGGFCA